MNVIQLPAETCSLIPSLTLSKNATINELSLFHCFVFYTINRQRNSFYSASALEHGRAKSDCMKRHRCGYPSPSVKVPIILNERLHSATNVAILISAFCTSCSLSLLTIMFFLAHGVLLLYDWLSSCASLALLPLILIVSYKVYNKLCLDVLLTILAIP